MIWMPLSVLLFQVVLDDVLAELWPQWQEKGFGIEVNWRTTEQPHGDGEQNVGLINNLCFADDMTLLCWDPAHSFHG